MSFLSLLIPTDVVSIILLDIGLHVFHLSLIVFILLGWVYRPLLRFHLLTVASVWLCWLVLGWYVGKFGYCVLTDWHWRVKYFLGETDLPRSYIVYLYKSITGDVWDAEIVGITAAVILLIITLISLYRAVFVPFSSQKA